MEYEGDDGIQHDWSVSNNLGVFLTELEIQGRIKNIQKTALLKVYEDEYRKPAITLSTADVTKNN